MVRKLGYPSGLPGGQIVMGDTYEHDLISDLERRFKTLAGDDNLLDRDEFKRALSLKDDYYADRLFDMVDDDDSKSVELGEFIEFVHQMTSADTRTRVEFAFRLHDPDDSGGIDLAELRQIIQSSVTQHGVELPERAIDGLTELLFKRADEDDNGTIDANEFAAVLEAYPNLKSQLTFSAATWLRPRSAPKQTPNVMSKVRARIGSSARWTSNNKSAVFWLSVYALVNIALFWNAAETYAAQGANIYVQIARGGGACLNFNGALILLPMLRHLLTWVRASVFGDLLPVDDSIAFHKLVGHVMMVFAVIHTIAHFLNYSTLPESITFYAFETHAGLTGVLLMAIFLVMWVCALEFIRRGGHFELFYFTHFGYVAWFVLALMHGPVFWQWASVPIAGYVIERIIRTARTNRAMPVNALEPLTSGVTRLELQLPDRFRYRTGDYVFIKYPEVSKHEWHPFTVTTCPEETGRLSVHVRGLGNWTKRLYKIAKSKAGAEQLGVAYIDGPYGTPATRIFDSHIAVLIGAGIGVTPFAAILKSLFLRRAAGDPNLSVEKIHFFWMNRDQHAFEWFSDMIADLERQDLKGEFLDAQIYLTGVKLDMTSAMLDIAMDVYQQDTGKDLLTGLRNRTNLDRPQWPQIFADLAEEHASNKVDVFFCGPAPLAKQLSVVAAKHGFGFHKENF